MAALFSGMEIDVHAVCLHHSVPRDLKAFLLVAMETFYPLHFLLSLVFFVLVHLTEAGFS